MISEDTSSTISSPASADGHSLSGEPDGQTVGRSGPEAVRVSRSVRRASVKASKTTGTCGPSFDASSPTSILQQSLASRLQARMGAYGSPEYELTWKQWDMASGPPICALRASARRTSDSDTGGPLTGWNTPRATDGSNGGPNQAGGALSADVARIAGWPTPMAGSPGTDDYNPAGNTDSSRKTVALIAGWVSPQKGDGDRGGASLSLPGRTTRCAPERSSPLGGWPSPKASNSTGAGVRGEGGANLQTVAARCR